MRRKKTGRKAGKERKKKERKKREKRDSQECGTGRKGTNLRAWEYFVFEIVLSIGSHIRAEGH